jgi:hypothetical protein
MSAQPAGFCGSQIGEKAERPLHYTGSPWRLFVSDLSLFFRNITYLPGLFLPLNPWLSGDLCELYPSLPNLLTIALHCVLSVIQLAFLISLPFLIFLPFWLLALYVGVTIGLNTLACLLLNAGIPSDGLKSTEDYHSKSWAPRDDEYWIFLNGICVG